MILSQKKKQWKNTPSGVYLKRYRPIRAESRENASPINGRFFKGRITPARGLFVNAFSECLWPGKMFFDQKIYFLTSL
jgi:hypothetical protein